MNDFTATLTEFLARRCELVELERALEQLVGVSPADTAAALTHLERYYQAGHLRLEIYQALKARVPSTGSVTSDADATRIARAARAVTTPVDDGVTRMRPATAPADNGGPHVRLASASLDDGATRMRPTSPPPASAAPTSVPSTPTTGTRDAMWREGANAEEAPDVKPGFVLKGRFVLEEEVGRGGMGVVFRARDLRKEEAQDRDPFVAIKILNDEFRRHPESLKALQREARKAQTLAHPNIATVWDFDRDGAIVYIQMEFLQGRPLDVVIRESGGMPYREAYPLIAGIGRALSYAHGMGIVHSDFKPGNCFAMGNNVVKVFDFGIARAAKIQGAPQRDDLTRFDAGTLGALTPAYASCEMLDGMEPDARDDIYALGCVAYELLTGKHPFGKQSATEARAAKLAPPVIKGLTPRQQRGLQRTLAFRRDDRTRTVAEFLEALGERKLNKGVLAAGIVAAVAVVAVGAALLQGFFEDRRIDALVADLGSGAAERVEPALEHYRALDPAQQTTVLLAAREPLLTYFVNLVNAAFDPAQQRYDYARAEAVLATGNALIPDSERLGETERSIVKTRADLVVQMHNELGEHINASRVLPIDGPDATDVLEIMRQASPAEVPAMEALLLPSYAKTANAALGADDVEQARALIDFGLARAPGDTGLLDLRDQLAAVVEKRAGAAAANAPAAPTAPASEAAQREALAALLAAPSYNTAWETRARDVLGGLERTLPAGDTTVADARSSIGELYVARAATMRGQDRLSEAQRLLGVAASFSPDLGTLAAERTAVDEARVRAAAAEAEDARSAQIASQRQKLIAATTANNRAEASNAVTELRRLVPANDPFLTTDVPAALAGMAVRLATGARDAGRLDEAEQFALEGLEAAPGTAALTTLLADIQSARASAAQPARLAGQPCTEAMAGYGSSGGGRGQCWDMIDAEQQGPRLVVVPKGGGFDSPYAIGRFEMAVAQWNAYCASTGACTPIAGEGTNPLANVTVAQARAYAEWLSERTGARYRLPTTAEWQHAVAAPRTARNDDNCVVAAAGRGGAPRRVTQGQQNEWGLLNYQGNVQEWAEVGGGAVEARGGTYRDPLDACVHTRGIPHDGSADAVTGFRLVREITGP